MHCRRSVRRSPATLRSKAGFDEPAFFYLALPTLRWPVARITHWRPTSGGKSPSAINYMGSLAISREK